MTKELKDLLTTMGLPEAKADEFAALVDDTNRTISRDNLIVRTADAVAAPATTPAPAATPVTPPAPVADAATPADPTPATPASAASAVEASAEPTTLEISQEMWDELVKKVSENVSAGFVKSMEVVVNQSKDAHRMASESQKRVEELEKELAKERDARTTAESRLANLEAPEEQKRAQYQADMPRKSTVVITRPRVDRAGNVSEVADLAAMASQTLSKLPAAVPATIPNGGQ